MDDEKEIRIGIDLSVLRKVAMNDKHYWKLVHYYISAGLDLDRTIDGYMAEQKGYDLDLVLNKEISRVESKH